MKSFFLILSLLLTNLLFSQGNDFFSDAHTFLQNTVSEDGVDYESIHDNPQALKQLVNYISANDYTTWDKNHQISYLINAYNILVIDVLNTNYPTDSPTAIEGFFDTNKITLNHRDISLNHLEKTLLSNLQKDARFHFALVCGAKGCPPLSNQAFIPKTLEQQLTQQARKSLNDNDFIRFDKERNTLMLSKIFDWYADDFGGKKNLITYINQYRDNPIDVKTKVSYYDYDWSLNKGPKVIQKKPEPEIQLPEAPKQPEMPATIEEEDQEEAPIQESDTVPGNSGPKDETDEKPILSKKSNVQTYTPSVLLKKGKFDFTFFNSIYTQDRSRWMGIEYSGSRETFFNSLVQLTYGISKSSRINVGLDLNISSSGRSTTDDFSNIGRAFAFENNDSTRVGLSSIGLRVKIAPFKNVSNFSIESTFSYPTTEFSEGRSPSEAEDGLYFLSWDRYLWWNRFFYDKTFNKSQIFVEGDLLFRLRRHKQQYNALDLPVSVFYSYFLNRKSTVYVMMQHVERVRIDKITDEIDDAITTPANYTTYGFGGKYQLNKKMNLELLFTDFFRSKNAGLGETYNLGIKYIF